MTELAKDKTESADEVQLLNERMDSVPDWIWEIDLDGLIRYSNQAVQSILGYNPQAVIGMSVFDLLSAEDTDECRRLIKDAALRGEPIASTVEHFQAQDSSYRTVELECVPMFGEKHALIGYRGIARDATERVTRLEQALEAEANYKIVAENSPSGLFIVHDERIVYANPTIRTLMGYEPGELLGTPVWKYVHPGDAARFKDYEKRLVAGEDLPTHAESRGVTKSGDVRYFDLRMSIIQHSGAPALLVNAVDITDSVHAKEALTKSEHDYRELVEETSDWVWRVDENGVYTYVSPRCRDLIGYEPDEVLGKTPFDFMPVEEAEHVRTVYLARAGAHEPFALLENTIVHRDGHRVAVETSGSPVFDDTGVFRGYRGIDRDVTARKQAEEQLRKKTTELESVFHAFPDVYFWIDADGTIADYHAAEPSSLYASPDEFLGKRMAAVVPEDIAKLFDAAIAQVQNTGAVVPIEYPLDVGERKRYSEARLLPLPNGQLMAIVRDITERRCSEEALRESREMLRLVMDSIPQFIFWKDTNSVFLGCNMNLARAAGLSSPSDLIGKTDFDMPWGETQAKQYVEWDRRVMESDQPHFHISETQLTAEGDTIWLDTNKVPLHDSEGRVVGVLGTYEDITERKRAEQALQEAEAMYRSLTEETMVGVYLIQDGRFIYVNPRMLEIFSATQDDMLERSPLEFAVPGDRVLVADNIRKLARDELKSISYGFQAIRTDGTQMDVEVRASVTTYKGRSAIIGSLIDITERKRYIEALQDSEERYRQLFEHSPDMVMLLSTDSGKFIAMNPAVTRVLGYAPYEVLGRAAQDLSPKQQPDGRDSNEKAGYLLGKARGAPAQRFDWVFRKADGSLADCEVSLVGYRFHGEGLIQAIVRDVTERKRAEENRRKFEREIEAQKRSFYRETILSVTGGTLDICDEEDVKPYIERAAFACRVEDASQVSPARRSAEDYLVAQGLTGERLEQFMVGVGEAITNAIKHGVHGVVRAGSDDALVWVAISDSGPGIESLILPRAVLLRGFSTKPSLGLGYSIMLDVSDRILLTTGDKGTTVVLIKEKTEHEVSLGPELLPDTWSNIPG